MIKQLGDFYKNKSLSHGTLRNEDLIPEFAIFLEEHAESNYAKFIQNTHNFSVLMTENYDGEQAHYTLEDLFDALNDIAPDGCYFGAHEGDGSDFGFWEFV